MAPDTVGIITLSHGIISLRIMVRDLALVMVESPKRLHTINFDGVLIDRLHHLQRGVYLIMVPMLPEWQRPNVRYYFCRLVFRFVHQVCFYFSSHLWFGVFTVVVFIGWRAS